MGKTSDNYIRVETPEKPFNSLMTEIFERSNIEKLMQRMFLYAKTLGKNPSMSERGFTLD